MRKQFELFMAGLRNRIDDFFEDTEASTTSLVKNLLRWLRVQKEMPDAVSEEEHKMAARYLESGRDYYNRKKYPKALKYFQRAVNLDGRYGLAHYYLGLGLYKDNRVKAAKAAWQRAIDVDPNSEGADKAREKLGNEKIGANRRVRVVGVDSSEDGR